MGGEPVADTGVIAIQMGGPATLKDVRGFLFAMLSDPAILSLPAVVRIPLAGLISLTRAKKVRKQYESIGGGSPIVETSHKQAAALESALADAGTPMPVALGNRYVAPSIPDAVASLVGRGVQRIVALPLYPQYSETTTGSAFGVLMEAVTAADAEVELVYIPDYADDAGYAASVWETVRSVIPGPDEGDPGHTRVLFSAHGLPVKYVEAGDPYPDRVAATVDAVVSAAGHDMPEHVICYQSRVGPVEWLSPSAEDCLLKAAGDGVETLIMVPIAFVSDHLETLYEMDQLYAGLARKHGIRRFLRAPAPNLSPAFIGALAEIVRKAV